MAEIVFGYRQPFDAAGQVFNLPLKSKARIEDAFHSNSISCGTGSLKTCLTSPPDDDFRAQFQNVVNFGDVFVQQANAAP